MGLQNVVIDGVTLLSGNPEGITNTVATVVRNRRAYLVTGHCPLYTTGDTAGMTGINTAIAAATRNGKALKLIAVVPVLPGMDSSSPPITSFLTATANAALTIANATTTGDATTGILGDADGTAITTNGGVTNGLAVVAIVDESP